ncbi:MAG: hypothetical protein P0Y53_03490 [Candidatus Pseudobacter hemicellulosilyticus]|uniref:Uncharacterized protein n=1 Tax=Candidatus Pseudobacter hemicellulosilyticus TaxID=3121375 RepID=A0AAJ5WVX5_9BACT|nr:MAG: hypothetical protein P0Y53_03490 [Pseudobacter sp.]
MDRSFQFVLSLSIIIAVIIGIVRYRKMDRAYYPFVYFTIVAFLMELAAHYMVKHRVQTEIIIAIVHVYGFLEFFLFARLFHNWGLFNRQKDVFYAVAGAGLAFCLGAVLLVHGLRELNYYFLIAYSFALIFFSVSSINKMVVHDRGNIFRNPQFIICLGIIIFYIFFILVNVTYLSGFRENREISVSFRTNLQNINVYSNLLVNLLYAVAMIWIPRKQNFMMPF